VPQASDASIPEFVAPSSYLRMHSGRDAVDGTADKPQSLAGQDAGDEEQKKALVCRIFVDWKCSLAI
jgi:hypothetical protein